MPPIVNPRNERVRADQILARGREFREDGPPLPTPGMPRGYVKMLMEERAARFRPGMPERTMLGGRCEDTRCGDDACLQAGRCLTRSMLMCGACWDAEKVSAPLVVLGPLDASVGISCGRCGATGSEAQPDTGIPTGYTEAMARIAEWNATIDQRSERRKECITPFDWLPLWHPGASWQR